MTNSHAVTSECVCVSAVTFYFALKAVTILLCGGFLVGFLVVLLGAFTIVVNPFYSILLHWEKKYNNCLCLKVE